MKKIIRYWWVLILVILWIFGLTSSLNKLTYKEFVDCTDNTNFYCVVNSPDQLIKQSFKPTFDITRGFSVKIGTFSRDNNSNWKILLLESKTSKVIYEWNFNASKIIDNSYYKISLNCPLRLNKNKTYDLVVSSANCNQNTSLAFYCDSDPTKNNNKNINFAFKIYGGNIDYFWIVIYAIYTITILYIATRIYFLRKLNKSLFDDIFLHTIIIGVVYFTLMYIFSTPGAPSFTDETDNMRGGILIANGKILYNDYVTQHTPFAYYLCGLYALLGAISTQQFRLLFYTTCALVWGILYFRHAKSIGKIKMAIIPILQIFFLVLIEPEHNGQILSDNIQGLAMVALMLEFVEYRKDYKLNWSRIIVISFSIFSSFGYAFVSIFSIAVVFLFFIISEFNYFNKNKHHLIYFLKRYSKLIFLCLLPFVIVLVYFYTFGALENFYEMAYLFNKQVYPSYSHYGENIIKTIFSGFTDFFGLIVISINSILNGSANIGIVFKLLVLLTISIIVFKLIKKKEYVNGLFLFIFMCMTGTRGNVGFHSLAYWNVALLILILYSNVLKINKNISKNHIIVIAILAICFVNPYILAISNYAFIEQTEISNWENLVIKNTHDGEGVLIETYYFDSLYLLYKNRFPVNRLTYFLPWYMDWYEQSTIDDLNNKSPNILIYCPDMEVWGIKNFCNNLNTEIQKEYTGIDENLFVYKKNK